MINKTILDYNHCIDKKSFNNERITATCRKCGFSFDCTCGQDKKYKYCGGCGRKIIKK